MIRKANQDESPMLVILCGPSYSGKSTLLDLLSGRGNFTKHRQDTDRQPRPSDGDDVRCVLEVSPSENDYIYTASGGVRYGIQAHQIKSAFDAGKHHILICANPDTALMIARDHHPVSRLIYIDTDLSKEEWLERQRARGGMSEADIEKRWLELEDLRKYYNDHPEGFHGAIINKFSSNKPEGMIEQFDLLF
jgi:guanylate kinase